MGSVNVMVVTDIGTHLPGVDEGRTRSSEERRSVGCRVPLRLRQISSARAREVGESRGYKSWLCASASLNALFGHSVLQHSP